MRDAPGATTQDTDGRDRAAPVGARTRRLWVAAAIVALVAALFSSGVGREPVTNPAGWPLLRRFFTTALTPDLSGDFLRTTLDAAIVTMSFAVLGTALAVVVGIVGGSLMSDTWWNRPRAARGSPSRFRGQAGWRATRSVAVIPRGLHEAVWGLFLVNILGRDPMVGVIAIAIPFGAITAKVYADLIDTADRRPYESLRAAGVRRTSSILYGILPQTFPDLVSYGFYRFECSIRASVILGLIGAGGLGLQLSLSFQALQYREMWTLIYALVLLSAAVDAWGSHLRRKATVRTVRASLLAGAGLCVASFFHLDMDLPRLWSAQTRSLLADAAAAAWPPSLPADGWVGLLDRSLETLRMSFLAIVLATALAVLVAFVAARSDGSPTRRAFGAAARLVLLVTRAIPPPVWALLLLFVFLPGPLPGALALGVYNFGIVGRLYAEVIENLDDGPGRALRALGSPSLSIFAFATLPLASPAFAAYALYRWEVAIRESVVVGVVGAGGLGRLLEQQRAAFDYSGMLATAAALVVLSLAVDVISTSARRALT
ncbi:phosphonate ABC transporter, permease protein PhnE [soil metagenome]